MHDGRLFKCPKGMTNSAICIPLASHPTSCEPQADRQRPCIGGVVGGAGSQITICAGCMFTTWRVRICSSTACGQGVWCGKGGGQPWSHTEHQTSMIHVTCMARKIPGGCLCHAQCADITNSPQKAWSPGSNGWHSCCPLCSQGSCLHQRPIRRATGDAPHIRHFVWFVSP